jgi:hypothetical protein
MGRRRTQRADDTVRQLLLADHYRRCATNPGSRWYLHGYVCDYCRDLAAGEQIVVSSSGLVCALMHAGLPSVDDYAFGAGTGARSSCWTKTARCRNGLARKTINRRSGRAPCTYRYFCQCMERRRLLALRRERSHQSPRQHPPPWTWPPGQWG